MNFGQVIQTTQTMTITTCTCLFLSIVSALSYHFKMPK